MKKLSEGIWTWPWFSAPHGYDFNGTLVEHVGGNLCIDPVQMDDAVLSRIAALGVARIVITNRNHTRAALRVRERTGARIAIHADDAPYAASQGVVADEALDPGRRIGPFDIVPAPGKSPGEVALHDPKRRLLVVGDVVIGNPSGKLSLLAERVMDDPARLRSTTRALLELDFDAIVVGDGVPILNGASDRLRELVRSYG